MAYVSTFVASMADDASLSIEASCFHGILLLLFVLSSLELCWFVIIHVPFFENLYKNSRICFAPSR